MPSVDEVYKQVSNTMKIGKVGKYGPENLPAGPKLDNSKDIIIVEGRADIINLMRCGIANTVALEGAKIPDSIKKLTREKEAIALLDGDRGGDLILKELMQVTTVKYVGRAPRGKEIEECNCKEISKALAEKVPINRPKKPKKIVKKPEIPAEIIKVSKELEGTLEAVLLNAKLVQIERLPVSKLAEKLHQTKNVKCIVFDGIITQRIVDIAAKKNINRIVASRISEAVKPVLNVELNTIQSA
jgi:DNA primase